MGLIFSNKDNNPYWLIIWCVAAIFNNPFVFPDKTNSRGFQRVLWKGQLKQDVDPELLPSQKIVQVSNKVPSSTVEIITWINIFFINDLLCVGSWFLSIGFPCLMISSYFTCQTPNFSWTCFINPVHKHVYFSFYSMLICRFKMPNQTQLHNMRCKKSTSVRRTGNEKWNALPLLIQVGYKRYLHKPEEKKHFRNTLKQCVWWQNI